MNSNKDFKTKQKSIVGYEIKMSETGNIKGEKMMKPYFNLKYINMMSDQF